MAEEYKLPYSGADIYRRLRDVDLKAKVMTMTTEEYNALEETDANTLYLMTDGEDDEDGEEVLITVEDIDAICGTTIQMASEVTF